MGLCTCQSQEQPVKSSAVPCLWRAPLPLSLSVISVLSAPVCRLSGAVDLRDWAAIRRCRTWCAFRGAAGSSSLNVLLLWSALPLALFSAFCLFACFFPPVYYMWRRSAFWVLTFIHPVASPATKTWEGNAPSIGLLACYNQIHSLEAVMRNLLNANAVFRMRLCLMLGLFWKADKCRRGSWWLSRYRSSVGCLNWELCSIFWTRVAAASKPPIPSPNLRVYLIIQHGASGPLPQLLIYQSLWPLLLKMTSAH